MQSYSNKLGYSSVSISSSYEKLTDRITTRVMAIKIMKQKEHEESIYAREQSLQDASGKLLTGKVRKPSKFLLGTSIPNSIIKSELHVSKTSKEVVDKEVARAKRDASVKEIMARMESRFLFPSIEMLPRKSETIETTVDTSEDTKKLDDSKEEVSETPKLHISDQNVDTFLDALKEQRRIRRRTSLLSPIDYQRESTYDVIKNAIQNTKASQEIVDVDSIRNKQLKIIDVGNTSSKTSTRMASTGTTSNPSRRSSAAQSLRFDLFSSKTSKLSRKSTTSSASIKKMKSLSGSTKSILKHGRDEDCRPLRKVSISEDSKKEDSQTQTYLRMKDFI